MDTWQVVRLVMAAALPGVPDPSETEQSYVVDTAGKQYKQTFVYASSSLFPLSLLKLLSCRCLPSACISISIAIHPIPPSRNQCCVRTTVCVITTRSVHLTQSRALRRGERPKTSILLRLWALCPRALRCLGVSDVFRCGCTGGGSSSDDDGSALLHSLAYLRSTPGDVTAAVAPEQMRWRRPEIQSEAAALSLS